MSPKVILDIAELQDKTVSQLVQRYEQVFKEECRSRNKQYLVRRIAWRLQANDEGGLSIAALKKAEELAVDADTRVTAPRKYSSDGVKLVLPEPDSFVDWGPATASAWKHRRAAIQRQYDPRDRLEGWI